MIIVNLKGGLGNQMFQYALGRKLSLSNKDVLKLEIKGLERANAVGDTYRPFSLGHFNVENNIASADEVQDLKYPFGIISKGWRFMRAKILRRNNKLFYPRVLQWSGNMFLDGYWQSPLYFNDIREVLLRDFTLSAELSEVGTAISDKIQNTESIAVHIRRGDYASSAQVREKFGLCAADYFQRAIAHAHGHTNNPTFFIFSDDPDWVHENLSFPSEPFFVSGEGMTDAEELALMSNCKHNIISNSSFSWWAAWLNQNPDKIVIAPTPWFNKSAYDPSLIPDSWTQIPKA